MTFDHAPYRIEPPSDPTIPLPAGIRGDGNRVTTGAVIYDLGYRDRELEKWAADVGRRRGQTTDWFVDVRGDGSSTIVRAPVGFVYDGASLPTLLPVRILAGKKERYETGALFHDLFYRYGAPRAAADRVFWAIARTGDVAVGPVRAWLTWAALRVAGWRAYRSHRETWL